MVDDPNFCDFTVRPEKVTTSVYGVLTVALPSPNVSVNGFPAAFAVELLLPSNRACVPQFEHDTSGTKRSLLPTNEKKKTKNVRSQKQLSKVQGGLTGIDINGERNGWRPNLYSPIPENLTGVHERNDPR